ncbi:MAG: response regulator [Bdellovibrionales bacterium]|nr:response regulator [Bdellovibrionales bacterium]
MNVLEKKRVLIVDDEPMLREILRDLLEFEGALVGESENGRSAFDLYRKEGFDAVVSDIRMPGGDGLELLENLRRLDCVTPVVMLITGFSDLSHDAAYNLGADAVLSKPFDVQELLARLSFLLSGYETRLSIVPESTSAAELKVGDGVVPSFGRGGMFVPGCISGVTGDQVSFSLDCPEIGGRIEGSGIIRWVRRVASGDLREGSGIEFRFLKPGSLQKVLDWNQRFPKCAFIPDRIPK